MKIACLCPTYFRANCLFDAIYCFLKQNHTDKHLLILDDTGSYQNFKYKGVEVVSVPTTFRTLPEKYNAMVGMTPPDAQICAVWEDDDLYLPWHLKSISSTLELFRGPVAYHHDTVMSDDGEKMRTEPVGGRFHASLAFNRECFEETGGWKVTPEASFDLQFISRLTPFIQRSYQEPSYYFRWGRSDGYHGQSAMVGYHDKEWTEKARSNLQQVHKDKMSFSEEYRFKHYCFTSIEHSVLRAYIDWCITGTPSKAYDFDKLLSSVVKAAGELETLDFSKLNTALSK
jgi:hypothetical protein